MVKNILWVKKFSVAKKKANFDLNYFMLKFPTIAINCYYYLSFSNYLEEVENGLASEIKILNPSFRKPMFMQYSNNKVYTGGKDLILPCMAVGEKPIKYTWKFNGESVEKKKRTKFAEDK